MLWGWRRERASKLCETWEAYNIHAESGQRVFSCRQREIRHSTAMEREPKAHDQSQCAWRANLNHDSRVEAQYACIQRGKLTSSFEEAQALGYILLPYPTLDFAEEELFVLSVSAKSFSRKAELGKLAGGEGAD